LRTEGYSKHQHRILESGVEKLLPYCLRHSRFSCPSSSKVSIARYEADYYLHNRIPISLVSIEHGIERANSVMYSPHAIEC
jgi:hypothetical protein